MVEVAESDILQSTLDADKIYCANCLHCKLVKISVDNGTKYRLRVKCDAGKWRKKLGEEKYYKYFTVARRSVEFCDSYVPMGNVKDYLRDLKKTLPIKDEAYIFQKAPEMVI